MKKKVIISIVVILAVAVLAAGVFLAIKFLGPVGKDESYAGPKDKTLVVETTFEETGSEGTVSNEHVKVDKSDVEINYKDTVEYTDTENQHVYTDKYENEYMYSEDGKLVEFKANSENVTLAQDSIKDAALSENEIADIAIKYAKGLFGSRAEGYELKNTNYFENEKTYSLTFVKKVGEDGFIIGSMCFVEVLADGTVTDCMLSNENVLEKLGEERINKVSKDTVLNFVEKKIFATYSENAKYEIQSITLVESDGKYSLRIVPCIEKTDGKTVYTEYNFGV